MGIRRTYHFECHIPSGGWGWDGVWGSWILLYFEDITLCNIKSTVWIIGLWTLLKSNGKLHEYKYLNLNNARTCVNNYRRLAERIKKKKTVNIKQYILHWFIKELPKVRSFIFYFTFEKAKMKTFLSETCYFFFIFMVHCTVQFSH